MRLNTINKFYLPSAIVPTMDTNYLTTQVTTIIGQLHGLFDDIGVPSHERESREAEASLPNFEKKETCLTTT